MLQNIKYDSVMGPVKFDDHNQANLPMMLLQINGGKIQTLGTFHSQPAYPK